MDKPLAGMAEEPERQSIVEEEQRASVTTPPIPPPAETREGNASILRKQTLSTEKIPN
jgi:hypothetical protein